MAEEHYTPAQAARILARTGRPVSERRIRQMLQAGELEGEQSQSGRWRILRRAVHALMEESPRNSRERNSPGPEDRPGVSAEISRSPESVRELLQRVESSPTLSAPQRAVWSSQSGQRAPPGQGSSPAGLFCVRTAAACVAATGPPPNSRRHHDFGAASCASVCPGPVSLSPISTLGGALRRFWRLRGALWRRFYSSKILCLLHDDAPILPVGFPLGLQLLPEDGYQLVTVVCRGICRRYIVCPGSDTFQQNVCDTALSYALQSPAAKAIAHSALRYTEVCRGVPDGDTSLSHSRASYLR
jgi:hypothetical protein